MKQSLHLPYYSQLSQCNVSSEPSYSCVFRSAELGVTFCFSSRIASVPSLLCPCFVLNQQDGAFYRRHKTVCNKRYTTFVARKPMLAAWPSKVDGQQQCNELLCRRASWYLCLSMLELNFASNRIPIPYLAYKYCIHRLMR
jgi:hypothetical protein